MQVQEVWRRLKDSQTETWNQGINLRESSGGNLIVKNNPFQSVAIELWACQRRVKVG